MSVPLELTSPTLACRAIDARWDELRADTEKLSEQENEVAIAMLVQWIDLATAALSRTPAPTIPRQVSAGRREPVRPAHAAAKSLAEHVREATSAVDARMALAPATAGELRQWQTRTTYALETFDAIMNSAHSRSASRSTPAAAGMPMKDMSLQPIAAAAVAVPAQNHLLSPAPVVVHATAVVIEDDDEEAARATSGFVGRLCRMLTGSLDRHCTMHSPRASGGMSVQDAIQPLTSATASG